MTTIKLVLLSLIVPVLSALDIEDQDSVFVIDERAEYRQYVRDLDPWLDHQVEYLATVIPIGRVDALRKAHYEWRLQRDLQCAETGRKSSDELAELKCLSKSIGAYLDRRSMEICEIEDERAKTLGIENTECEKVFPGTP